MKKISIIIVAYKNGKILKRNLERIRQFNDIGDDLEVIVVDNGYKEESIRKYIEEANLKNCICIDNTNDGFGGGNNLGALFAQGEILGFINPDVYLIEPIFASIYNSFLNDSQLSTLGCKLYYDGMRPSYSFSYEYEDSLIKKLKNRIRNMRDDFHEDEMFTSGADLFIRKDLFYEVGRFDEQYFMYYEEADLKRRIKKYDKRLTSIYRKDLRLIHLGGSEEFSEFRFQKLNESALIFGKKWGLDYKKKIKYEYDSHILKKKFYRFVNKRKYDDVCRYIEAYEKYYPEYIK